MPSQSLSEEVFSGFWKDLPRPIVGLAPMDGVTDHVFRKIVCRYGRPDVVFTEFTNVTGVFRAPSRVLKDFEYDESQRPIVAQIYGSDPEEFYWATIVVCELGFDGIDVNMGCPSRKVTSRNCGAKLIQLPELASEILQSVRRAVRDWSAGLSLRGTRLSDEVLESVLELNYRRTGNSCPAQRRRIPFSVKTRIGYESVVVEEWLQVLLDQSPAVISLHGRTLKQMYRGEADWQAIQRAVLVSQPYPTLVLGNGDIRDLADAARRVTGTGVDGVLLGRSTIGNPWVFLPKEEMRRHLCHMSRESAQPLISAEERARVALEHAFRLEAWAGQKRFLAVRKHLKGYLRGFPGSAALRDQAMRTRCSRGLEQVLESAEATVGGTNSSAREDASHSDSPRPAVPA